MKTLFIILAVLSIASARKYVPDGTYLSDTNVFVVKHGPGSPNDSVPLCYWTRINGDSSTLYYSVDGVVDTFRGSFQLVQSTSTMRPDTIIVGGNRYVGGWLEASFWIVGGLRVGEIVHGSAITSIFSGFQTFTFTAPSTRVKQINLGGYAQKAAPRMYVTLTGRKLHGTATIESLVRCGNHSSGSYHHAP